MSRGEEMTADQGRGSIAEVFALIVEIAPLKGAPRPLRSVYTFTVPSTHDPDVLWELRINGRNVAVDHVPPFHVDVLYGGWPAGIVGMGGGVLAAGAGANERALVDALVAERDKLKGTHR